MKIVKNTSGYQTSALRAVMVLAHKHIRSFEQASAPRWQSLRVVVRGRSRGHVSGCAILSGSSMWLTVPREGLTARRLLWLSYHELMHSFGYRHRQFKDLTDAELAKLIAEDYVVPVVKKASKPDAKPLRVAALLQRRDAWQAKLRRAQTALRKITRSLRYYERQQPQLLAVSERHHAQEKTARSRRSAKSPKE